ncbi:MAG: flagellar motor switch protein FliG [Sandaracinaceae bacterium]|nr:flagellar motor switch protein FliG [Sandaracinaceae bacterium]
MSDAQQPPPSPAGIVTRRLDRRILSGVTGSQKSLLFLVSLDETVATKVLGHLTDEEVRALRESSERTTQASPRVLAAIHQEFLDKVREGMPASLKGSTAYLRRLAGNALGEGRAAELWTDAPPTATAEAIAKLDTAVLEAILDEEQAQTIAVVLSQLPATKAAELVERMSGERRNDVLLRLARLESVPASVLRDIEQAFASHVQAFADVERHEITGKKSAADIVKRLPNEFGQSLLTSLRDAEPQTAQAIERLLFVFEDLLRIDGRGMQQLLKEVPTDQLVLALKTASEELKEKVFGNVSSRAADLLHEELSLLGPVKLSDVETAQQAIVQIALELERDGRIQIQREGGGGYV